MNNRLCGGFLNQRRKIDEAVMLLSRDAQGHQRENHSKLNFSSMLRQGYERLLFFREVSPLTCQTVYKTFVHFPKF